MLHAQDRWVKSPILYFIVDYVSAFRFLFAIMSYNDQLKTRPLNEHSDYALVCIRVCA